MAVSLRLSRANRVIQVRRLMKPRRWRRKRSRRPKKKKIINIQLTSENQTQKMKTLYKPFLPALAIFGLLLGCGSDKDAKEESGGGSGALEGGGSGAQEGGGSGDQGDGSSGAQGGGEKATGLAKFLSGKRIACSFRPPGAPPEVPEMTMLIQFESDGTITMGTMADGKAVATTDKKPVFKVDGLKVTLSDPSKNGDATMTFSSANPKVGDKITFRDLADPKGDEIAISAIEKAGKLEMMALPENPGSGEPEPEGFGGGPAFGMGPNGEFAKSKHPAFITHTWKSDPFMSKGVEQQTATFGKAGVLTITFDKGKPVKGWDLAAGLLEYSERREAYVDEIREMITYNDLHRFTRIKYDH